MTAPAIKRMSKGQQDRRASMFERALDCLPDGVLLVRGDRTIAYANTAFAKMWSVPETLMASGDDFGLLTHVIHQLVDPAQFTREVERLYGSQDNSDDELLFKDGRIFSRRSVPVAQDGDMRARIWVFTDVSEARQAFLDSGTGLANRRAYTRDFPKAMATAEDGLIRSVAILDVDNFKSYNDIYGHAAGDAVLRKIGDLLRARLRNNDDYAFRIGGEEFLFTCKTRTETAAMAFFEELRKSIVAEDIPHDGNSPYGKVTASLGLGIMKGPQEPTLVFQQVDAALYRSKTTGKNKVSLALFD